LKRRVGVELDVKAFGRTAPTSDDRTDWTWGLPDGRKTVLIDTCARRL